MTRKPLFPDINLALDMDQVINHFEEKVKALLADRFPDVVFKNLYEMEVWDHSRNYTSRSDVTTFLHELFTYPPAGFYLDGMRPVDNLRDIVRSLQGIVNVWVVSNPLSEINDASLSITDLQKRDEIWCRVVREKKEWLRVHLQEDAPRFIPTDSKHVFHGQIIIDDRPDAFDYSKNTGLIHVLYDDNYRFNKNSKNEFRLSWNMDWENTIQQVIEKVQLTQVPSNLSRH